MKRLVSTLLIVIFLMVLSGCSDLPAIAVASSISSEAESGSAAQSASAQSQSGAAAGHDASSDSSAAPSTPPAGSPAPQPAPSQAPGSAASLTTSVLESATGVSAPDYREALRDNALSIDYHGERLTAIHALDVKNYLTARYHIAAAMGRFDERYFGTLLEACDTTPKSADRAFILFTDKGRHYVYLDENTPPELNAIWETIYSSGFKNIHWLTHMTTAKIEKITFGGWSSNADMSIGLTAEDRTEIAEISDFLKNSLTVNAAIPIKAIDGLVNPSMVAGIYDLTISFDNGIRYSLLGYGDYGGVDAGGSVIHIGTSDLGKSISYTLNEGEAGRLRDFMEAKQLEYRQKNGLPTRMNVKILPVISMTEKLIYSKDLNVPLRITNNSVSAIIVTTDFVTRWRPSGGGELSYMPWGEGHPGQYSENIPAGSSAVIQVPFSAFELPKDGGGKYETEFWIDGEFRLFGGYVVY